MLGFLSILGPALCVFVFLAPEDKPQVSVRLGQRVWLLGLPTAVPREGWP